MVYQGSKNRISKQIVPIIQSYIDKYGVTEYIEFFGGGANVIDKIKCQNRFYYDINDDLVALLNYAQKDPLLSIAPDNCTKEHYAEVKADVNHQKYSKEYRALIGYMASYGGKYFNGGYGRDAQGQRCIYGQRLKNFRNQNLQGIVFDCRDYKQFDPESIRGGVRLL